MWSAQCEVSIRAVEASERNQRLLCGLGGTRWAGGDRRDRAETRERPRCPEAGAANTAAQTSGPVTAFTHLLLCSFRSPLSLPLSATTGWPPSGCWRDG